MRESSEMAKTNTADTAIISKMIEPRDRAAVRRFASGASAGVGGATAHHRGVFEV